MKRPSRLGPIGLFLPLALALVAATASPALAQGGGISNFTQNPEADRQRDVRKPSGLPGARGAQRGTVAPAERLAADMAPNEALFDAVNRGDVAAARDAISRGAQVEGRNILGLTPLELSIDLGRNELTFLLLSMRGASSAPPPPSVATRSPAPRPAVPRAAERPAPERVAAPAAPPRQRQSTAAAAGTPVPQAGFLGFGSPLR
jgi:hypothetical protein